MLNNMIASFAASNQIGEQMKKDNAAKGIVNKKSTREGTKEPPKTDFDY
jgi:hypothetical protein